MFLAWTPSRPHADHPADPGPHGSAGFPRLLLLRGLLLLQNQHLRYLQHTGIAGRGSGGRSSDQQRRSDRRAPVGPARLGRLRVGHGGQVRGRGRALQASALSQVSAGLRGERGSDLPVLVDAAPQADRNHLLNE